MAAENTPAPRLTAKQFRFVLVTIVVLFFIYAFAIPNYADYTTRTRVAEGLSLASSGKVAIAEYYDQHNAFPPNNAAAGLAAPTEIKGNSVTSVEISTTGIGDSAKALITITYNKKVYDSRTIILSTSGLEEDGRLIWDCSGGTIPLIYRPVECRNADLIGQSEKIPAKSTGFLVFILCMLLVKCIFSLLIKRYFIITFFLEVITGVTLFQAIDYIYLIYFTPFYPNSSTRFLESVTFFWFGLIISLIFEFSLYPLINKFLIARKKSASEQSPR